MTIDEAIKIQQYALADKWGLWSPEMNQAIRLSTEALKRLYLQREHPKRKFNTLLPGETQ